MKLAMVVNSLWGAKQDEGLIGRKLIEAREIILPSFDREMNITKDVEEENLSSNLILAVDPIGAGIGEIVLISIGSRVRDIVIDEGCPTKNCVIAIVDRAFKEKENFF